MADPYNAKDVILERIRLEEGIDVQLDDVEFEDPVRVTDALPLRNTFVRIRSKTQSDWYGVKTFHYNRIHISEVGVITVERGSANNDIDLLPAVNLKYGLYMVPEDIINKVIPPGSTGEITVSFNINPNSLTWYDGDIIVTEEP